MESGGGGDDVGKYNCKYNVYPQCLSCCIINIRVCDSFSLI